MSATSPAGSSKADRPPRQDRTVTPGHRTFPHQQILIAPPDAASFPLAEDAAWIWLPGASGKNTYVEFLRRFRAGRDGTAWIQLSAGTSLRLWLNGELIHRGPPREAPPYFYFDTINLRPLLRAGENELRIVAHHQGENSQSHQAGVPAILVAGSCDGEAGSKVNFAEAEAWLARRMTCYRETSHRLFSCLGFSEHVDFSAPETNWQIASRVGGHPWPERPQALARDLPPLRETVRLPRPAEAHAGGWLVDMGQEVAGYLELTLRSNRALSLRVAYAEELIDGGLDPAKGGMQYFDRLEIPGSEVCWQSYEKRAFRYLHLDGPVEILGLHVIEETWPYERAWQPATGQGAALRDRIFEVSARTLELNTEDLLTDCPWRERAQYLDCQHYMGAMQKLFGTLEPIRRFLRQFPRGAGQDGLLRMCYPSVPSTTIIPDFSISYVHLLAEYLRLSGDTETVRQNLPMAERGVTVFRPHEDGEGLLTDVPGWIFLDNTFELPKFPRSAGLNAVYHGGYRALARLHEVCGDAARAAEFSDCASRVRQAWRSVFLRDGRVLDADTTPDHERFHQWVYHYSAETGRWHGASFRLRVRFRRKDAAAHLYFSAHAGARVWIDGRLALKSDRRESWTRSAIFERQELPLAPDANWHELDAEVQGNGIDWECYLASESDVEWSPAVVWEEPQYGVCGPAGPEGSEARRTALRRHIWPWMSQVTVGLAAFHGLLEDEEARRLLRECLPPEYVFPFMKRTTPIFATVGEKGHPQRILPCNVPASMFSFCHALRRYGMETEARGLLLSIYEKMLARGATTWWEEWNSRSSLCHAWACFVVEFLDLEKPTADSRSNHPR